MSSVVEWPQNIRKTSDNRVICKEGGLVTCVFPTYIPLKVSEGEDYTLISLVVPVGWFFSGYIRGVSSVWMVLKQGKRRTNKGICVRKRVGHLCLPFLHLNEGDNYTLLFIGCICSLMYRVSLNSRNNIET